MCCLLVRHILAAQYADQSPVKHLFYPSKQHSAERSALVRWACPNLWLRLNVIIWHLAHLPDIRFRPDISGHLPLSGSGSWQSRNRIMKPDSFTYFNPVWLKPAESVTVLSETVTMVSLSTALMVAFSKQLAHSRIAGAQLQGWIVPSTCFQS